MYNFSQVSESQTAKSAPLPLRGFLLWRTELLLFSMNRERWGKVHVNRYVPNVHIILSKICVCIYMIMHHVYINAYLECGYNFCSHSYAFVVGRIRL